MFLPRAFAVLVALSTGVSAAALKPKNTCSFSLGYVRTQNPVDGGDNTLSCSAELDYGGRRKETLTEECNVVSSDNCYVSQLPYTICIHTNPDNTDGYLEYSDEHRDFNEDGCSKDSWATIAGDSKTVTCSFPCS